MIYLFLSCQSNRTFNNSGACQTVYMGLLSLLCKLYYMSVILKPRLAKYGHVFFIIRSFVKAWMISLHRIELGVYTSYELYIV